MRQRKQLININTPQSRKRKLMQQTKDIQRAIMDVILKDIEDEINNRFCAGVTNRAASYGVMDRVIKKHKNANPWLLHDTLNNYKRLNKNFIPLMKDITNYLCVCENTDGNLPTPPHR